ncbi:perlucin-like protein [Mytilus galloprovincialis]|uniref:perlucin-like protein n=1 Tax=Mytilus galloprovincialis TaxID=29158 RepID=UPI003F7C74B2
MFISVILVLSCISLIESRPCDRSKEKTMIYELRSLLNSLESKINDNSCECGASEKCPDGWKKYKEHCYFFSPDSKTWHNAANQCKSMRGYLVQITDSAENSWVLDILKISTKHRHGSWIGASDLEKEGDWRWINDSSKVRYSQWHPGQPSNYGNREDCGHFASGYGYEWNDAT